MTSSVHHESLVDMVQKVNSVAPGIFWSNLESAVDNSILRRRAPDETVQVRAYSSNVRIANDSVAVERFSIQWGQPGEYSPFNQCFGMEFGCQALKLMMPDLAS